MDTSTDQHDPTTPSRRSRRGLRRAAAAALLTLCASVALAAPAQAIWWAPNPPTCHTDSRWVQVTSGGRTSMYLYAYAYRYTTQARSSRGVAYTTHYVYDVQNVFYPHGLITVGRADKICGQTVR